MEAWASSSSKRKSHSSPHISSDFLRSKPVLVEPSAGQVSSDAGLLPFRQLDERIGLTREFAEALDDPMHGDQQLTFLHGYYGQSQYLPRAIPCAENDLVLNVALLFDSANPAFRVDDDLAYVVSRLRKASPGVRIYIRGDCGFGVPTMHTTSEHLEI